MKRIAVWVLALLLGCACLGAAAEDMDMVGDWVAYMDENGHALAADYGLLSCKPDGTFTMVVGKYSYEGKWEKAGGNVQLTITDDLKPTGVFVNGDLSIALCYWTKKPEAVVTLAAPKSGAVLADYVGTYSAYALEYTRDVVKLLSETDEPAISFKIGETEALLTYEQDGRTWYREYAVSFSAEQYGQLILRNQYKLDNEDDAPRELCTLYEDGTVSIPYPDGLSSHMRMYLTKTSDEGLVTEATEVSTLTIEEEQQLISQAEQVWYIHSLVSGGTVLTAQDISLDLGVLLFADGTATELQGGSITARYLWTQSGDVITLTRQPDGWEWRWIATGDNMVSDEEEPFTLGRDRVIPREE